MHADLSSEICFGLEIALWPPSWKIRNMKCLIRCKGNHMISSAICDKSARVKFSKANQIAQARRASAICSLWKIYECWFIPNCTRKIIWLLINNTHTKISLEVDDKQNVFSGLPFRFVLKHYGVVGLCKIQIPLGNFKSLCHLLSGAFILIQLYWFGLKCPTPNHACNLSSYYEPSRKKMHDW